MDIMADKRPIDCILFPNNDIYKIGKQSVTKIEPYFENGEMAVVVWFKIWEDNFLFCRVNGKHVQEVHYKEEDK